MKELRFGLNRELNNNNIEVGAIYKHKHGLKYRVDSDGIDESISSNLQNLFNVTDYEQGVKPELFDASLYSRDELKQYILYTQLEAGDYPAGQKWARKKEDFLANFIKIT